MFDFTDSKNPVEIAFFDRGPVDEKQLRIGGYWSTYWYNGYIYGSEMMRGLDIFRMLPTEHVSQNEIDAANLIKFTELNVQHQPKIVWPASFVVARAYIDQLTRAKALANERATALVTAMDRAEKSSGNQRQQAVAELERMAGELESRAGAATSPTAAKQRALASSINARAAQLR
jgi:hypothetical protein